MDDDEAAAAARDGDNDADAGGLALPAPAPSASGLIVGDSFVIEGGAYAARVGGRGNGQNADRWG